MADESLDANDGTESEDGRDADEDDHMMLRRSTTFFVLMSSVAWN